MLGHQRPRNRQRKPPAHFLRLRLAAFDPAHQYFYNEVNKLSSFLHVPLLMQLLLQFPLPLLGLVYFLLLLLVKLLLLLKALLDPHPELVFVFGLLVAYLIGLWTL